MTRQLAGSRGILSRKGATTLMLRPSNGFRAQSQPASLRRLIIDGFGEHPAMEVALLTTRAVRTAYAPAESDAALLREAGAAAGAAVTLFDLDGTPRDPKAAGRIGADAIRAFFAGAEAIAEQQASDGSTLLLARVAEDRVIALPVASEGTSSTESVGAEPEAVADSAAQSDSLQGQGTGGEPASVNPSAPVAASDGADIVEQEPDQDQAATDAAAEDAAFRNADPIDDTPQEAHQPIAPLDRPSNWFLPAPSSIDAVHPVDAAMTQSAATSDSAPAEAGPNSCAEPAAPQPPRRRHSVWSVPESETDGNAVSSTEHLDAAGRTDQPRGAPPPADATATSDGDGVPDTPSAETEMPIAPYSDVAPAATTPISATDDQRSDVPVENTRAATAGDFAAAHAEQAAPKNGPDGGFAPRLDAEPVRFVWRIDSDGRFRSLSPEFSEAVGPISAAIVDRSIDEVAHAYGFDADGALRRLLKRRETWSGRTVMWPVETTAKKVPVDLAALPVFARDRTFDGFRGFGVVRLADAEDDPEAIGLAPAEAFFKSQVVTDTAIAAEQQPEDAALTAVMRTIGAPPAPSIAFGRRDPEVRPSAPSKPADEPAPVEAPRISSGPDGKVIRLEERRRGGNGTLSQTEEAAFRAIGETLAQGGDPRELVEAVRSASERIDEIEWERLSHPVAPASSNAGADDAPAKEAADSTPSRHAAAPASGEAANAEALLEASYGTLPLPILAQVGDALVYANREFFDLTGHEDLAAFQAAGGLETLVQERQNGDDDCLRIRRANGRSLSLRARLQRSCVGGVSCLILSFFATPRLAVIARDLADEDEGESPEAVPADALDDAILNLAADGVVLIDPNGLITAMSATARALFEIPEDDLTGRPFLSLFAHESQKGLKGLLAGREAAAAPTSEPATGAAKWFARREVIGRVAGGAFLPLSVTLGHIPRRPGCCAVVQDITSWKRSEQTLEKARSDAEAANLQKTTFLSEVAQEIRDPVDAMIGLADLISSESLGPVGNERYLEYLDDIKRSGHQVIDLVTILHDLAKVESSGQSIAFEAVSLAEIVDEVTAIMGPKANRQRVIIRTHLPSSVPPVVGDPETLRQITTNLVANSIRSTPAGGQLIVSTRFSPETGVTLRFRDSGVGMRQDEIESAMRAPGIGHNSGHGTRESGRLGLPLTKALAEANRAQFSIASTPGEGTMVEVRFPLSRVLLD
ncbi:ATP-binding protein [Jiella sp. MQZ9-1]|uniref:histidine kinase n=1 Tax=Jiella flava TaxID=2816857 RepID=A0A939FUB2_9HYPH|nr:ATP-binding protein [Jiella flava]MBO0661575.1 PAS domain-containing protein [Jiella flava]MCD2470217.1 ATP-binding protein [Jiella flava]